DLYHGNLLYALSMFLDLCHQNLEPNLHARIVETLQLRARAAREWFVDRDPHSQRYTQNHFYIPLAGLLCAANVLLEPSAEARHWLDTARPYLSLIFDALGTDGWFFEGPDYFHYAFIWLVRLAELARLHLELDVSDKPCFTNLKHFLRWTYFPKGDW